jgi:hypothetical protein
MATRRLLDSPALWRVADFLGWLVQQRGALPQVSTRGGGRVLRAPTIGYQLSAIGYRLAVSGGHLETLLVNRLFRFGGWNRFTDVRVLRGGRD